MAKKLVKAPAVQIDLQQYKGIVYNRALHCHGMLPPHVKNWVEVEDLVQDGMLFLDRVVHQRGNRKATFDASKSSFSTWVYSSLSNFYAGWAAAINCKKRFAILVSIEDSQTALTRASAQSRVPDLMDAYNKVQRLHACASIPLVEFLDTNLFHTPSRVARPRGRRFAMYAEEFRALAKRFDVTLTEYRAIVLTYRKQGDICHSTGNRS